MGEKRRYVPVLRWRSAEQEALKQLASEAREVVTPLVEVIPSRTSRFTDQERTAYMHDVVSRLREVWGTRRAYLDGTLLRPTFLIRGVSPIQVALEHAQSLGMDLVPVVTLPRQTADPHFEVFGESTTRSVGLCLRLKPIDFALARSQLAKLLERALAYFGFEPEQVDIVVDEEITYDFAPGFESRLEAIPLLDRFRSLTVIGGSFPPDLQELDRGLIHSLPRKEWTRWCSEADASLPRFPDFGDYTVQYAAYRPPPPDQIPKPSVSIRYTSDQHFVVLRGEARRDNGPGYEQWIGRAKLLFELEHYKGEDYSAGDRYIKERTLDDATAGNFAKWISAGINHHITLAANQVANFRGA